MTLLETTAVSGCRISRKKTSETVHASVPQFVIDELWDAPHDSEKFFFGQDLGSFTRGQTNGAIGCESCSR